jgi:drug/metabolite transporter (DMT)-like permease
VTRSRLAGIALGLAGLATMFNPLAFDWSDRNALIGNSLLLLAALCWAANILYVRAHRWIPTPFQLVFWQALLATFILSALALWIDGIPLTTWSPALAGAVLYAGICGTALAHWAMVTVNRSLRIAIGTIPSGDGAHHRRSPQPDAVRGVTLSLKRQRRIARKHPRSSIGAGA